MFAPKGGKMFCSENCRKLSKPPKPKKERETVKTKHGDFYSKFRETYFGWDNHKPQTEKREAFANMANLPTSKPVNPNVLIYGPKSPNGS